MRFATRPILKGIYVLCTDRRATAAIYGLPDWITFFGNPNRDFRPTVEHDPGRRNSNADRSTLTEHMRRGYLSNMPDRLRSFACVASACGGTVVPCWEVEREDTGDDLWADLVIEIIRLSPGSLEPDAAIAIQRDEPPQRPEIGFRSI
jgi:hypothetical protein